MKSKVLILGGTSFIGRHFVEQMLSNKQFELVLANRGITNRGIFPEVSQITYDRKLELPDEIANEKWDFIVDFSCYFPHALQTIIDGLIYEPKKYIFISTCSVYDNEDYKLTLRNESAPILSCTEQQKTDETTDSYGARKAECERILIKSGFPFTVLRPALVVGPYDSTDRLYYWLHQIKKNHKLMMPNGGINHFSITYVNDLVNTVIASLKDGQSSDILNVISIPQTSINEIVTYTELILNKTANQCFVEPDFLIEQGIKEWVDIPLWLNCNYYAYSNERIRKRLSFNPSPLQSILENTIEYFTSKEWYEPKYGINNSKKNRIFELYDARNSN